MCLENEKFLIGAGIHDVTGPAAEVGMMGYSMPHQKTAGIHIRLRSRAFVISSLNQEKMIVLVSADLGMVFQAVKQAVLRKLEENVSTKGKFKDENVMLSANHTHSGPGGYSHYSLYNLSIMSFDEVNFDCIVYGIYMSILKALGNLEVGYIYINRGELENAGKNRSPEAYKLNFQPENPNFPEIIFKDKDTNKEMTLLKFVTTEGKEIGLLNWFAVHSTSIGNTNRLISGDNKGYASYLFEKTKGAEYSAEASFVAAFAQAEAGDVTPNIWGYPDGIHDFEHMQKIGERQFEKAKTLYDDAETKLACSINYSHLYVDFSDVQIEPEWQNREGNEHTCRPALGFSKLAGSTEDGVGVKFIPEGMTFDKINLPTITLLPELQKCHGKKRILIPLGEKPPFHFTQQKLPLQIVTIGQLALLAVPFECTTMAGRYLKKSVEEPLALIGIDQFQIAGYANAYAGYVTTPNEYNAQHYEGASTHFGPNTLNACQQKFNKLARGLATGEPVDTGPIPPDLSDKQIINPIGVLFDFTPPGIIFGDIHTDVHHAYSIGQTVKAVFWGGHPRNDPMIQNSYLTVEHKSGNDWNPVAYDWDPETIYRWKREETAFSLITVEWAIPSNTVLGEYRISHFGHYKEFWTGEIKLYWGVSSSFIVSD